MPVPGTPPVAHPAGRSASGGLSSLQLVARTTGWAPAVSSSEVDVYAVGAAIAAALALGLVTHEILVGIGVYCALFAVLLGIRGGLP